VLEYLFLQYYKYIYILKYSSYCKLIIIIMEVYKERFCIPFPLPKRVIVKKIEEI